MTLTELQTQIDQTRATVHKLKKAATTPSGDIDADITVEQRLGASERLLARLERQLSEALDAEKRRQEKADREAAQARLSEIEATYAEECAGLARVIDEAALFLEPVMSAVIAKRRELGELHEQHYRIFKQVNGQKPDALEKLWSNGAGPVPMFDTPKGSSALYPHMSLALLMAINEREGGRFTLQAVLGAVTAATVPHEAQKPSLATPKPAESEPTTPMQRFARGRRPNPNYE